jgi:hypothetical protein
MNEIIEINSLSFEVRRSNRRTMLGLTVDRGGELTVHAPDIVSTNELKTWINKKILWVYRKLTIKENLAPVMRGPEYVSGEAFFYLGRRLQLKVVSKQEEALKFNGIRFLLRRDARPAERFFQSWYIVTGRQWLLNRVNQLSQRTSQKPKRIEVRDLGFRWASCGKNGVLFINWKVLQLPIRLVDYIIMHELIHLEEKNHGVGFWKALSRSMPDWKKRKDALDTTAKEFLIFGLNVKVQRGEVEENHSATPELVL